jgi:hypothetical protein
MTRPHETANRMAERPTLSRQARLHALLFASAALGTTVLALGAPSGPKIPPFVGE